MALKRGGIAVYPIGSVMRQTGLTGRQIRYYEQMSLIEPTRSKGNQRLYSDEDVDRLSQIKRLLDEGYNIEGIRAILEKDNSKQTRGMHPGLADDAAAVSPYGYGEEDGGSRHHLPDIAQDLVSSDESSVRKCSDAELPYVDLLTPLDRDVKLVSLYPVNNRARLENLLLAKHADNDAGREEE